MTKLKLRDGAMTNVSFDWYRSFHEVVLTVGIDHALSKEQLIEKYQNSTQYPLFHLSRWRALISDPDCPLMLSYWDWVFESIDKLYCALSSVHIYSTIQAESSLTTVELRKRYSDKLYEHPIFNRRPWLDLITFKAGVDKMADLGYWEWVAAMTSDYAEKLSQSITPTPIKTKPSFWQSLNPWSKS